MGTHHGLDAQTIYNLCIARGASHAKAWEVAKDRVRAAEVIDRLDRTIGLVAGDGDDLREALLAAEARSATLQEALDHARHEVEHLEAALAEAGGGREAEVYAVLGLLPEAHRVVIHAARRALLTHWHPDRHADERTKAAAQAQFARVSAAADQIVAWRGRG